ncbi:MAG: hypothetical protein HZB99_03355 [Candidatus Harrisonbacteria bacterium]|nr:hypothetical protein [Candidatus Harrisonbacteria bacterium]
MFSRNFFIFSGVLILVVVLAAGSLLWWQRHNDPVRQQQALLEDYQRKVEEAYSNDTYGGSTPEETLRLFVEALKKEDIELASKYFALDDNLDRGRWYGALKKEKENGKLSNIISVINRAQPGDNSDKNFEKHYFNFIVYRGDGEVEADISLVFNPTSKVWKIESL